MCIRDRRKTSSAFGSVSSTIAAATDGRSAAGNSILRSKRWRIVRSLRRAPGAARDFLAGLNVLSIVVEVPRARLKGAGSGKIALWCTTSK